MTNSDLIQEMKSSTLAGVPNLFWLADIAKKKKKKNDSKPFSIQHVQKGGFESLGLYFTHGLSVQGQAFRRDDLRLAEVLVTLLLTNASTKKQPKKSNGAAEIQEGASGKTGVRLFGFFSAREVRRA